MPHVTPRAVDAAPAYPRLPHQLPLRLQDLPPAAARFCLRVADFLTAELARCFSQARDGSTPRRRDALPFPQASSGRGLSLVVGVSGGADSLALLLALRWLAPRLGLRLHAATLDHGLRPESAAEVRAVGALCRRLGVSCRAVRVDVATLAAQEGCGLEDAGRRARYALFAAERRRTGADWVCTAHQSDDLCEDVLLRLVRGAGWPGLGGMVATDPARRILRPLLMTERGAIDAFLAELDVHPVRDPANADQSCRRNRLRHEVLPLLRAENPALSHGVRALWELARCDDDYWTRQLAGALLPPPPSPDATNPAPPASPQRIPPPPRVLTARTLRGLHRAARLRLYKYALDGLGPGQPLAAGLMALDAAWRAGHEGALVQFPGGKRARVVPASTAMGKDRHAAGGIEFSAPAPCAKAME